MNRTLNSLFKSRKFLLAIFGLIQSIVLHYFNVPPEIWQMVNALVGIVILGIAAEDSAEKISRSKIEADVNIETE